MDATTASSQELTQKEVVLPSLGVVRLFVQGNLEQTQGKAVFLTCHDIGANHKSFVKFFAHPAVAEVRNRSVVINVCLPGHNDQDSTLPDNFQFPTLECIGRELIGVLDQFNIRAVIGMGEGAGANVVCRFAMAHPNRCLGIVLIHCTSTPAGLVEQIKDKVINWRLSSHGMNQTAWAYLIGHKFGVNADPKQEAVQVYAKELERLNAANLGRYIDAFTKRTDLSNLLATAKTDALLVVGGRSSDVRTAHAMQQSMNKANTSLMTVDNAGDVLTEAPEKLARALILFCQGCGVLSGIGVPGMPRKSLTSSISMEEADRPRRLSLSRQETVGY